MKTEFSKFEVASIKRTAQNCAGMIAKFEKLNEKIAILQAEKEKVEQMINNWDAPIVAMTGYHVMDLVERERVKTGKDKDGNDIFGSKWVMKYPETIIPVDSNNTSAQEEQEETEQIDEEAETQEEPSEIFDDENIKF